METTDKAWLRHVAGSTWLALGPRRLVVPRHEANGRWVIGDIETTDEALLAARPPCGGETARRFDLIHQDWRVATFRLFRPLVYFTVFAASEMFDCLELAVRSLLRFGRWRYDVLVLTAAETEGLVRERLEPLGLGERLHVATVAPTADMVDWCLARYRLDAHPVFRAAQPLLYLDADIICDRPLEPLLATLVTSDRIHACREGLIGEGSPDSAGHWFGWRLMDADKMPFDPNAPGFSAGALGVANADIAGPAYDLILRSAYGYAERAGTKQSFEGYDQCFANYVLFKLDMIEIDLMARVLNLYRIPESGPPCPDPARARGLVHFQAAPYEVRLKAMQAYCDALGGATVS